MRIGFGVFLVAIGAILTFATHWHISGLNLHVTGDILMLIGAVWAGIGGVIYHNNRHTAYTTRRTRTDNPLSANGDVIYEEEQSIDGPVQPTHQPGIYDEVIHPGQAVTYPKPEVLEDPPSPYNHQ